MWNIISIGRRLKQPVVLYHDHAVSTKMLGGDGNDIIDQRIDDDATSPISVDGGAAWRK